MFRPKHICIACGSTAQPRTVTPGHIVLEACLWLAFLVPGLLYSVWRMTHRKKVCRTCGSAHIIPIDSPKGRQMAAELKE